MKTYLNVGVPVKVIGCYSEAFCHCKHAGKAVMVELVKNGDYYSGAVIRDGNRFTGFTTGECGIMRDESGFYVHSGGEPDENPEQVQADLTRMILEALK